MSRIEISIPRQELRLLSDDGSEMRRYPVSTARNGPGELNGSNCTPRGRHIVRAKIGAEQPVNAVFVGRRPTGEIWTPELAARHPGRAGLARLRLPATRVHMCPHTVTAIASSLTVTFSFRLKQTPSAARV